MSNPPDIGSLDNIPEIETISNDPKSEYYSVKQWELSAKISYQDEQLKDIRANRRMRQWYAFAAFLFLFAWVGIVTWLLIFSGDYTNLFRLPTSVLVTLVGSTTVSAIGLVHLIAGGLFNNQKENKN